VFFHGRGGELLRGVQHQKRDRGFIQWSGRGDLLGKNILLSKGIGDTQALEIGEVNFGDFKAGGAPSLWMEVFRGEAVMFEERSSVQLKKKGTIPCGKKND